MSHDVLPYSCELLRKFYSSSSLDMNPFVETSLIYEMFNFVSIVFQYLEELQVSKTDLSQVSSR